MITTKQYFAVFGLLTWYQLTFAQAPGDVSGNLELWLKADAGVEEAASNAAEDGDRVRNWLDQSGNGNDVSQNTTNARPTFNTNQINSNPSISFSSSGTSDYLEGSDVLDFTPNTDSWSFFGVFNVVEGTQGVLISRSDGGTSERQWQYECFGNEFTAFIGGTAITGGTADAVGQWTLGASITATNNIDFFVLGALDQSTGSFGSNTTTTNIRVGARGDGAGGTGFELDGEIAELVMFSSNLNASDRRDVESYLAIKYGLTLDIASQFYTVGGSAIYSNTNFANDIAGIGQDDSQALSQATSKSINPDAIVTINNPSALSDGDYLVWGNDNAVTSTTISGLPLGVTERMTRVWGITETGNIGTATVLMDLSGLGYAGNTTSDFMLIIDDDDDFTNGVLDLVPAQSFTSEIVTFNNADFNGATNFGLGTASDFLTDTDGDGIPDYFEVAKGTNANNVNSPITDGNLDDNLDATPNNGMNDTGINGDGISDALERILIDNGASAPVSRITDTDGDGIPDYREVWNGTDPFSGDHPTAGGSVDSDSDGIPDGLEILIAAEGGAADADLSTDTDLDGVPDYYEAMNDNDPNDINDPFNAGGNDSDGDGISDGMEQILADGGASTPIEVLTDTDSDGIPDNIEAQTYSDPFNDADPFVPGTPAVRSILADYTVSGGNCINVSGYQWQHVFDDSGNLVYSINSVGNDLGSTCWGVRILNNADDDVRDDGYDYILDRNWYITPTTQPGSDVYVRFYTLAEEHTDLGDELMSAQSFSFDEEEHLRITKISGISNSLDPFITGGSRLGLDPVVLNYAANGKSLTFGTSSFSSFVPHVTPGDPDAILPIELVLFEAQYSVDGVILDWVTASEDNNDFFTIERSTDGLSFEPLEMIAGAGNSQTTLSYTFTDYRPFPGVNYYRVKQTDFDGKYSYSTVEMVRFEHSSELSIQTYPNPVVSYLTIACSSAFNSENVQVKLVDVSGRSAGEWQFEGVNHQVELPLYHLNKGVYVLEAKIGNQLYKQRIMKN